MVADAAVDASIVAEPPAPEFDRPLKLGPRVAGAASCSAGDLGATGQQLAARPLPEDCEVRWDAVYDAESRGKPSKERVVRAARDPQLAAIETTSASHLAKLVHCPHPLKIDWKQDHVWVVTYDAEDGHVGVGSVIDDGQTAVVGLNTSDRGGCGGAAPRSEHDATLALLPVNRAVALATCTSTEPPRHCTGLEK